MASSSTTEFSIDSPDRRESASASSNSSMMSSSNPFHQPPPSSSNSGQRSGPSKPLKSQQKPPSSNMGSTALTVRHQSQKVRGADIEMNWYHSIRRPGITNPPNLKDLKAVEEGYLYLHHLSKEDLTDPTIWIWEVKSDTEKRWVKIEKGHPYPHGNLRFLSISSQGKPSWNKRVLSSTTEVCPDEGSDKDE